MSEDTRKDENKVSDIEFLFTYADYASNEGEQDLYVDRSQNQYIRIKVNDEIRRRYSEIDTQTSKMTYRKTESDNDDEIIVRKNARDFHLRIIELCVIGSNNISTEAHDNKKFMDVMRRNSQYRTIFGRLIQGFFEDDRTEMEEDKKK